MKVWADRKRSLAGLFLIPALLVLVCAVAVYVTSPRRSFPYHDAAALGRADEWTAFAGNWRIMDGAIRNDSTEPGAKFITGTPYVGNYSVEADVQLLGEGDAGLAMRVSQADQGADAYNGYYAGLRTRDQKLVLGKAEYGWSEFPSARMPRGVSPGKWFHLRLSGYGCRISATATELGNDNTQTVAAYDPQCFRRGRFGLRSLLSGGVWRNIQARQITKDDAAGLPPLSARVRAQATTQGIPIAPPLAIAAGASTALPSNRPVQAIQTLRLLSATRPSRAVVRGSVVHTEPLYIEDSSGGAMVVPAHSAQLREGEEVEVEGDVYPTGLTADIRAASILSMGGSLRTSPPLSLTADQAATGLYHAMLIEVQGTLGGKSTVVSASTALEMHDGQQTFRAVADSVAASRMFRSLKTGSRLRLRAICLIDSKSTQDTVPFVLLIGSADNIKVLAGPPWWSTGHLVELALCMLGLGFAAHLVFSRAEEWRLRAVIDERERLAHEIHDTLAQSFAGIGFQLRAIRNKLAKSRSELDNAVVLEELNRTCELVKQSHDEARRSLVTLRPDATEARGLVDALEQAARQMVGRAPVKIETSLQGEIRPVPLSVLDSLFRIGQESIANAVQHSHLRRLHIAATYSRSAISLLIEDDGEGFVIRPDMEGFGLTGIRRRAESIRGTLAIDTAPGRGTRILVTVPMRPTRFPRWRKPQEVQHEERYHLHVS